MDKNKNQATNVWEVNDTERIAMEYEQYFNQPELQCYSIEGTRAMFYAEQDAENGGFPRRGSMMHFGLYEPIHGSAPDLAGKGVANPVGMILSVAMMLRHSLGEFEAADALEIAVSKALEHKHFTPDLSAYATKIISTSDMGDLIVSELRKL